MSPLVIWLLWLYFKSRFPILYKGPAAWLVAPPAGGAAHVVVFAKSR